jgi:two-component system, cell cycle response regulator
VQILVADDDPISAQILRRLLGQWGYDVLLARDGDEAWQLMQSAEAPRLAILDWEMPGMDGPELCRKLRERLETPYIYVILLTARAQRADLIAGMEAGADDYLTKPFDAHELRVRLRAGRRILDLQVALLEAQEALRIQATQDPVTGLWNRGMIMNLLHRELARARREGTPLSIFMADLDLFKRVNDSFGHLAGDLVLRETGQRMLAALRAYDSIGRYGGEEFLAVLVSCDVAAATKLAERIRGIVGSTAMNTSEGLISITVSIGIACQLPPSGEAMLTAYADLSTTAESLVRAADQALYRAKQAGRNRVEVADPCT